MEVHTIFMDRKNIVQMSILLVAVYRLNASPIKILMTYCPELEQIFQKFIWNHKMAHQTKEREEQRWRNHAAQYQTIL